MGAAGEEGASQVDNSLGASRADRDGGLISGPCIYCVLWEPVIGFKQRRAVSCTLALW